MNDENINTHVTNIAEINQPILIYGEALAQVPNDLYIPPEALQIYLDSFEGPLDLLLYLIRKAKFNIIDIPMAALTRQYLDYVEIMRTKNLNLAAEYLAMAAILIDIKCKMLLPRPSLEVLADGEEELDPRAALVKRLLQYEQIQQGALRLNELPQAGRDFFWAMADAQFESKLIEPVVVVNDLVLIWQELLTRIRRRKHHEVSSEALNLREQMTAILKKLGEQSGKYINFFEALPEKTLSHIVIGFIAVLELARRKILIIEQGEIKNNEVGDLPLYIKLSEQVPENTDEFEVNHTTNNNVSDEQPSSISKN